jgi:hypothetical protein
MSSRSKAELRRIALDPALAPAEKARRVAEVLDALPPKERIAALQSLGGVRVQRKIWEAAAANPPVTTDDLLPKDAPPMKPVVFHGKNSLPAFSDFRKICCRPPSGTPGNVLWGYNDTSIRPVIGPGYYVVHDTPGSPLGASAFDYTQLPASHPAGWPDIRGNEVGLSRFIYNKTVDYMRRVANGVFIGSATRGGREMGSYFILVRDL